MKHSFQSNFVVGVPPTVFQATRVEDKGPRMSAPDRSMATGRRRKHPFKLKRARTHFSVHRSAKTRGCPSAASRRAEAKRRRIRMASQSQGRDFSGCVPRYTAEQAQRLRKRRYGYTAAQAVQLHKFIREDRELWEMMLIFEPVDLSSLLVRIHDAGVHGIGKIDLRALEDYLHDEGVLFQDTRIKVGWNSWRARWHINPEKRHRSASDSEGSQACSDADMSSATVEDVSGQEQEQDPEHGLDVEELHLTSSGDAF
mmetsp:Transcript_46694/g.81176  ORF Transcript_46694/g.81176 Transcript_46694/m.81176 type:complete len:256 (-) Transcript_46694:72-839(-)